MQSGSERPFLKLSFQVDQSEYFFCVCLYIFIYILCVYIDVLYVSMPYIDTSNAIYMINHHHGGALLVR